MDKNWKVELIKDASMYILDFLIQSEGGSQYDNLKTKYVIRDILKKDQKKIQKTFILNSESEIVDRAYEFLYNIFKKQEYFALEQLNEEQENAVWKDFTTFSRKHSNAIYLGTQSKYHLIECINYHNTQIRNRLLDPQSILTIRLNDIKEKKFNNKIDKIINILDSNTALQEDDELLDYMNGQLESILASMKIELNQIRQMEIRCIRSMLFLLFLLSVIFVFMKTNTEYLMIYIVLLLSVTVFLVLLSFALKSYILDEKKQKYEINKLVESLYMLHFNMYETYLHKKIESELDKF